MASSETSVNAAGRLDRLPISRVHTAVLVALAFAYFFELGDLNTFAYAAPALIKAWGLQVSTVGLITSASFLGMFLGATIGGFIADRIGRRASLLGMIAWFSLFSLLNAVAWDPISLGVFRFLTGVGLSSMLVVANTYISEFFPPTSRGRYQGWVMVFGLLGIPATAWFARLVIPLAPWTWRLVFVWGALGILFLILVTRLVESPRWLEKQGQAAAARAIVERIAEGQVAFPRQPPPQDATDPAAFAGERRERLWQGLLSLVRQYPGRLALGCALDFSEAAGYYGLFAFLPLVVLPQLKWPAGALPWFYLIGNLGALAGGVAVGSLLERFGRKRTVTLCYALTALAMVALAEVSLRGRDWILAGFTLANLLATASWIGAYPTFTELFPTRLRSTGVGASVAFGRLGALASPFLILFVAQRAGVPAALWVLSGFWVLGSAAMLFWSRFGIEAQGRPLEALAPDPLTLL
jgi:MFS family permease